MRIIYKKDGDKICATFEDFVNLQENPAWFWKTKEEAEKNLLRILNNNFEVWNKIFYIDEKSFKIKKWFIVKIIKNIEEERYRFGSKNWWSWIKKAVKESFYIQKVMWQNFYEKDSILLSKSKCFKTKWHLIKKLLI